MLEPLAERTRQALAEFSQDPLRAHPRTWDCEGHAAVHADRLAALLAEWLAASAERSR